MSADHGRPASAAARARLALLLACAAAASCAHAPAAPGDAHRSGRGSGGRVTAVEADSVTSALWRMDEAVGTGVADAGPFHLDGTAGVDTRTGYGRIGRAREFTSSINSFVLVPYSPVLDAGAAFTIEAWIDISAFGLYEDTPIAARWTPQALQDSWMLSVVGKNVINPRQPGPGDHLSLTDDAGAGRLMFAFQPEEAGAARAFFSTRPLDLETWTHVAASYDGEVVRLYVNGRLDAQYASPGRIRPTAAPLLIGNYMDPRWLSTFGGDLRAGPNADPNPYYAFVGLIDEVRISSVARAEFPYARR